MESDAPGHQVPAVAVAEGVVAGEDLGVCCGVVFGEEEVDDCHAGTKSSSTRTRATTCVYPVPPGHGWGGLACTDGLARTLPSRRRRSRSASDPEMMRESISADTEADLIACSVTSRCCCAVRLVSRPMRLISFIEATSASRSSMSLSARIAPRCMLPDGHGSPSTLRSAICCFHIFQVCARNSGTSLGDLRPRPASRAATNVRRAAGPEIDSAVTRASTTTLSARGPCPAPQPGPSSTPPKEPVSGVRKKTKKERRQLETGR